MDFQLNKREWRNISVTLIIGICLGWIFFSGPGSDTESHKNQTTNIETTWTCSMHPQVRLSKPGQCPICAMDLIPVSNTSAKEPGMIGDGIQMSESALRLADVQTSIVKPMAPENTLYLFGRVKEDERKVTKLSARFAGRIEELHVNFAGQQVKKNQILATIYSPDLVTAQKELIESIKLKNSNPSFYFSVRKKLELWGISQAQIEQIEQNQDPIVNFDIVSPINGTVTKRYISTGEYLSEGSKLFEVVDLSKLWIIFEAYESELTWIQLNDIITFDLPALPGESFNGKITYIDPFLDPVTRIARVRVEMSNPTLRLKPEMLANGILKSRTSFDHPSLVIPGSSILWTGKRAIVYVKDQNSHVPTFLFREITLGSRVGDFYIVKKGIKEGEEIITHGVFKIDAAAQLAGKKSMMNRENSSLMVGLNLDGDPHRSPSIISEDMESTSFKVFGNCGMCKSRIEEAASSLEGVIKAEWNVETKILEATYQSTTINLDQIHQTIASVGHNTVKVTAPDSVYEKLPACCLYRE